MLPEWLAQIAVDEPIQSVGADGAYDTRGCRAAIAETARDGGDCAAQERQSLENVQSGVCATQRGHPGVQALWPEPLKDVERLLPAQPCRDADALLQMT
jgi:hypothetical protein